MTDNERKLIEHILTNEHSCPLEDEIPGVDFEEECVGFRKNGCEECVYKHIDHLR